MEEWMDGRMEGGRDGWTDERRHGGVGGGMEGWDLKWKVTSFLYFASFFFSLLLRGWNELWLQARALSLVLLLATVSCAFCW